MNNSFVPGNNTFVPDVLQRIRDWMISLGVSHREVHHEPTRTSEESARVRGEELRVGGKAVVMKTDDRFRLFVLPADRKIDSGTVRQELGVRKLRFADKDELWQLTGLVPGSVPPFGEPILPLPLYLDADLTVNDRIAFNAGSLTDSMIVPMTDYLRIARPERVFAFSVPAESPTA
jgi:prolyl-tRNA editing enzyme YbaK/EbsC (Cys-tRNA(Pro) deacylase)